jgi:predicted oxidoreductase
MNPDLTGKDVRMTLGRVLPGAPPPVGGTFLGGCIFTGRRTGRALAQQLA